MTAKQAPCEVPGCERVGPLRRGMCSTHYQRWRAHGDFAVTLKPGRKPAPTPWTVVQCGDCAATVGLTQDPRGIWTLLAAHSCQVAS